MEKRQVTLTLPSGNALTTALVVLLAIAAFFAGSLWVRVNSLSGSGPGTKKFDIVMQGNRYNPSRITVRQGDRVVINFTNRDNVSHAVEIPEFGATLPAGHVPAGGAARMEFVASRKLTTDAATCGGPNPTDKTDDHGEELIVNVI